MPRTPRPATDSITLQLDRWASLLRNEWQDWDEVGPTAADELGDLSTLLTAAANAICSPAVRD